MIVVTPAAIMSTPHTKRRRSSPAPGKPFGNMEKRRCRADLVGKDRVPIRVRDSLITGVQIHPFGGVYSSMIPRFSAIVTAWVRSLAPSLDKILLTWPLTVSSVIKRSLATNLLAFPAAIN